MIHTVEFRNFKALRHVKLELERFTVLVGPNASGKTSILEGLFYLTRQGSVATQSNCILHENMYAVWTRGAKDPIELVLEADEGECKAVARPHDPLPVRSPSAPPTGVPGFEFDYFSRKPSFNQWTRVGGLPPIVAPAFLRLDAKQLASPSFSQEAKPRVAADGQGLASALAYLLLNRRTEFDRLLELFRLVCPYVVDIRFNRVNRVNRVIDPKNWGEELVLDLEGAPDIPGHMVSDGTLLILGLLAVMMGPDHPKLILLDDLDHGLHPRAQRDLVALLRKLFEQDPALQIVATTHSPYLLDQLDPKEVRLTTRMEDGSVACARLDEHPDFEKWKEAMTPGEFWSMVGEKWVGERQLEAAGS